MIKKAQHCVYDVHYHLVIVMKYRHKILVKMEYVNYLCNVLNEIAERYGFEMEEIGSDGDHIHILVSSPPRYSPSKVMQIIKSITAKKMFKKFPEIRKKLWGGEFWSDSGYVGMVGQYKNLEGVIKYTYFFTK